jgi:leucine-rich repeat protein SHOC2
MVTQTQKILNLVKSGELDNIELALQLAKAVGEQECLKPYFELYDWLLTKNRTWNFDNTSAQKLQRIVTLDMFDMYDEDLKEIPDNISLFQNVFTIDFTSNKIKVVPPSLFELPKLKSLWIDGNQIETLPKEISKASNLKMLYMGSNPIEELPIELKDTNISHLDLSWLKMTELPLWINDMEQIEEVNIYNTPISNLSIYDIDDDIEVNMNGNQHKSYLKYVMEREGVSKELLESFIRIGEMFSIDLALDTAEKHGIELDFTMYRGIIPWLTEVGWCNEIQSAPIRTILYRLMDIKCLDIREIELTGVSEYIGALMNLTEFIISHNNVRELPPSFGMLQKMESLWLEDNKFEHVPSVIRQLKKLEYLYMAKNKIHTVPNFVGHLRHLKYAEFYSNELTEMPSDLVYVYGDEFHKYSEFTLSWQNPHVPTSQDILKLTPRP